MKPFVCTTFVILRLVLSYVVATEIGCKPSISEKNAGKAISRGEPHTGVSFVDFKEDKFSYLNITILGYSHVDWMPQCSLACLETQTCFSYNLAAYQDINGKLLCELLPSDKYNNSDKFMVNESFHHFSIASPCSGWPCKNNGTCLPLYEENSYKCFCKAGFAGRDCENDIDECSSENDCHVNATCTNTLGSYNCTCKKGYEGDGRKCSDIDECSSENECDVNASCYNTIGSYNCICKKGYGSGGRNCSDIDECPYENGCHVNATCTNTIGSYKCTCKKGYEGDGTNCSDIDECSSENECNMNATCTNTIGSYNCTCIKGYIGDEINCIACVFAFDSQLSASSQWDSKHAPSQGKLNYQENAIKAGAWVAAQSDNSPWLQVDLGSQKRVRTLATQGRNYSLDWPGYHAQWVTKYELQYSNDGENFQYYQEQGVVKEFAGNIDRDTEVHHDLNPLISARYFRFRPTRWHGHISMRVGLFGCPDR